METAETYASHYLSSRDAPTFLLHTDGAVIWSNQAAERLVASGSGVQVRQGLLRFSDKPFTTRLHQAIACPEAEPAALALADPDTGGHMVVHLTPLRPEGRDPAALVTVRSADQTHTHCWADIDSLFGLTPAEGRIARRLTDDVAVADIARSLGSSLETVRTHIRRLYAKLEVSSREELRGRLLPFRAAG